MREAISEVVRIATMIAVVTAAVALWQHYPTVAYTIWGVGAVLTLYFIVRDGQGPAEPMTSGLVVVIWWAVAGVFCGAMIADALDKRIFGARC